MITYRTNNEKQLKNYGTHRHGVIAPSEWVDEEGSSRIDLESWEIRYRYEQKLLSFIIEKNNYNKILELGSGPGKLGQYIMSSVDGLDYTFIDKQNAKYVHRKRNFKGKFIVKDLFNEFDISELDDDYDLVIANDFLEHISNPSDILFKTTLLTKNKSSFFISVPNWRMGHTFIYRGLFDYDNFLYFCNIHGWEFDEVFKSPLQCSYSSKLSSESQLPAELVTSWNWYFNFNKIID